MFRNTTKDNETEDVSNLRNQLESTDLNDDKQIIEHWKTEIENSVKSTDVNLNSNNLHKNLKNAEHDILRRVENYHEKGNKSKAENLLISYGNFLTEFLSNRNMKRYIPSIFIENLNNINNKARQINLTNSIFETLEVLCNVISNLSEQYLKNSFIEKSHLNQDFRTQERERRQINAVSPILGVR